MKKASLGMLLVVLFIFGCTAEKDFTMKFDKTFTLNYSSTSFTAPTTEINAAGNENFNKYKEDIKSVELQKVTYTITNFVGNTTQMLDTAVLIYDTNNVLSSIGSIYLASIAAKEQVLPYSQTAADNLSSKMMNSPYKATIGFHGEVNEAPVKFTITFTFEFKVTYEKKIL